MEAEPEAKKAVIFVFLSMADTHFMASFNHTTTRAGPRSSANIQQ